MRMEKLQKMYAKFVLPTYKQSPLCLVKGKGSKVWDLNGKEYIDFFPGWGVSGLGHCHPKVVSAVKEQVKKIIHISNNYLNLKQAQLAELISESSFPSRVFFCNSGAEAVEAAIKFARKYGQEKGKYEIITMENSFHGRTLAAITATAQPKYQEGFAPLVEGFKYSPFNDFDALQKLVSEKTVGVMLEPVQGEGGINVANQDYIKKLREFSLQKDILLIFDEVQTGMGRTGKMFAYQHYGVEPDLMILAKSLGGGLPIAALVVNNRIKKEVLTPGTHASTYGGNPLVCAAALAVFKAIKKEGYLKNVEVLGKYLFDKLTQLKQEHNSIIKEVRGLGLMLGLELSIAGSPLVDKCREAGLLINCTQEKVLRIMPTITVSKKLIDQAIAILKKALA